MKRTIPLALAGLLAIAAGCKSARAPSRAPRLSIAIDNVHRGDDIGYGEGGKYLLHSYFVSADVTYSRCDEAPADVAKVLALGTAWRMAEAAPPSPTATASEGMPGFAAFSPSFAWLSKGAQRYPPHAVNQWGKLCSTDENCSMDVQMTPCAGQPMKDTIRTVFIVESNFDPAGAVLHYREASAPIAGVTP